jgi:hypothetical protein
MHSFEKLPHGSSPFWLSQQMLKSAVSRPLYASTEPCISGLMTTGDWQLKVVATWSRPDGSKPSR